MIKITSKGDFKKADTFLEKMLELGGLGILDRYGREGVNALASATPRDTGKTAASWDYMIEREPGSTSITWTNSNINDGVNIAVIIQYGHGTGTGGYIQGIDYINPAIRPVFEHIADSIWEEVTKV